MLAQALEPVPRVEQVLGVGVVLLEGLRAVQKKVQEHGVGHQLGDLPDRLVLDLEAGEAAKQLEHHQEDGGAGAEGGGEELRREDRRVPVGARGEAVVEEGGDRVDAHRHRDRDEDEGDDQALLVVPAAERAIQDVGDHDEIDREVGVQHHRVPGQDGAGKVQVAQGRDEVPEALRVPDVDEHEEHAHDDGAHREQLAEDDDLADRLPVVDVGGDDEHHRCSRHSHQEREVADVEAPAHLVAHRGDDEPLRELGGVGGPTGRDEHGQERDPAPVEAVSPENEPHAAPHEAGEPPRESHRRLTFRRSRRTSGGC